MSDHSGEVRVAADNQRRYWWTCGVLALMATLAIVPLDVPIARLFASHPAPGFVVSTLALIAAFGNGAGVVFVLALCVTLDRAKLGRLPLLVGVSLGSGLLADVAKLCICRTRPHSVDLANSTFLSTFQGWFPLLSAGGQGQSFPSAHAATVVGLAIVLGVLYPRGRWLFATAAFAISIYRVVGGVHFPIDVASGALIGGAWSYVCLYGVLSPVFIWSERTIDRMTGVQTAKAFSGHQASPAEHDSNSRSAA